MHSLGLAASGGLALLLIGCSTASGVARGMTDAIALFTRDVHGLFPSDEYVTGVGHSSESLEAAEASAKAQAASTLREGLRSEVAIEERGEIRPDGTVSSRSAHSRLLAITATNLTPYFRVVPELARHSGGHYLAVVVARRDALAERLLHEAHVQRARATDFFDRVVAARDLITQAQAMCDARKAYEEVAWRAMALHLVTGRVASYPELDSIARAAERALVEMRAILPIRVAFRGPDSLLSTVASSLAERIRAAGLSTEIGPVPDRKSPLRSGQVAVVLARQTSCIQPVGAIFECRVNVKAEVRTGGATTVTSMSIGGDPSAGRVMGPGPSGAEALAATQFNSASFVDRATAQVVCLLSTRGCDP